MRSRDIEIGEVGAVGLVDVVITVIQGAVRGCDHGREDMLRALLIRLEVELVEYTAEDAPLQQLMSVSIWKAIGVNEVTIDVHAI